MKTNDYVTYQLMNDSELLELILSGDTNAIFYLIRIKYRGKLYGVIHNSFKAFNNDLSNDNDLEYWLYRFQDYMDRPTKIAGKKQFANIKCKDNIQSWLCRCCRYFILNHGKIEVCIFDGNLVTDICSEDFDTDAESEELYRHTLKVKMADYFFNFLNCRDSYIMYTYLLCEETGISTLHLDEKIANVLINHGFPDMSADHVRKIKSKSLDKAKKNFKKTINFGDIFHLLIYDMKKVQKKECCETTKQSIEENKHPSYKDILFEKRKIVMSKLGIEQDFLTDIVKEKEYR
jgi:hypothetical protein